MQVRDDTPGAVFHVTGRVNWQVWHLKTPARAHVFFSALEKYAALFSMVVLAVVLMSNHYHFVLISPDEERFRELTGRRTSCRHFRPWPARHQKSSVLSQVMQRLLYVVSRKIHEELGVTGRFWQGTFHATRLRRAADLVVRIAYDHRNPVRAGMVLRPEDYPWSSAAWWAGTGPAPIPVASSERLPFGLSLDELRADVVQYQASRRLDDAIMALRKKDIDWRDLDDEELRRWLCESGLPPLGGGSGAAGP